jgi:hypothetical protein
MFHLTDTQWRDVFFILASGIGFAFLSGLYSVLRVIAYNTGRTSENVAAVLNYLHNKDAYRDI